MPPKRRRSVDEESVDLEPRTLKRTKSTANKSSKATRDASVNTDPSDDDLVPSAYTPSVRASGRVSGRGKKLLDTPTKSATKVNGTTRKSKNIDPAAALILQTNDVEEQVIDKQTASFEAYFEQASRKIKTSDNTLNKLPALTLKEYLHYIKTYKLPYQTSCDALIEAHEKCFDEWSFEVANRYSLCLYGYGSKRGLIMSFVSQEAERSDDPYVVINGYHPHLDIRQLCRTIMGGVDPNSTASDITSTLAALSASSYKRLILAFHNIDGPNLRTDKAQSIISQLVAHEKVRLVCSIDHINAPRLWSFQRTHLLRLIFHDATTFVPYTLETEFMSNDVFSSTRGAGGGAHLSGDRGIKWILQTLSTNALTLFKILLKRQMETTSAAGGTKSFKAGETVGMESRALFEEASRVFAVSNRTSFTSQLQEFLDHEIIVSDEKGMLRIPFRHDECVELLRDLESGGHNAGNDDDDDDDDD